MQNVYGGESMRNQLREGIEEAKLYYILKLKDAGVIEDKNKKMNNLTLSELQRLVKFYQL